MARPLYDQGQREARLESNGHKGLWHERFFNAYPTDYQPNRDKDSKAAWATAKNSWLSRMTGNVGDEVTCAAAAGRQAALCEKLLGKNHVFAANWHFATGLGLPHPLENGFLWHPTLGTPYIPGAAVKGLVRAWVESWAELEDEDRHAILYRWFGSEDKDAVERKNIRKAGFQPPSSGHDLDTEAGAFIFFDALPTGPVYIKADVMTSHMDEWYAHGGEIQSAANEPRRVPADWHDPVPIGFLVADKPKFQFSIAPRNEAAKTELPQVLEALENALLFIGTGAKTAVGYGLMAPDEKATAAGQIARAATVEEAIRSFLAGIGKDALAKKFGRDRNKTKEEFNSEIGAKFGTDAWNLVPAIGLTLFGDVIHYWKGDSGKDKAYKFFTKPTPSDNDTHREES